MVIFLVKTTMLSFDFSSKINFSYFFIVEMIATLAMNEANVMK